MEQKSELDKMIGNLTEVLETLNYIKLLNKRVSNPRLFSIPEHLVNEIGPILIRTMADANYQCIDIGDYTNTQTGISSKYFLIIKDINDFTPAFVLWDNIKNFPLDSLTDEELETLIEACQRNLKKEDKD